MGILKSFNTQPSRHSLKGETPDIRDGALKTSQLHAQGEDGSRTINPNHSIHDLDGISPSQTYTDIITAEEAEG